MHPACELKLDDLRKTYLLPQPLLRLPKRGGAAAQPKTKKALAGVSLTLGPGLYGLLGPNGAGKSTLINIITGGLAQDGGSVLWCGKSARALDVKFRRALGFMPQQQGLYDSYTGRRFLAYMAALKELHRADVPAQVDRVAAAVNLTGELDKRLSAYSGGMKQRLLLAQAILAEPKLLILDEPTAGLDPRQRIYVRRILSDIGKDSIVLIATHVVSDVEKVAKEIMMIGDGKLLESGSPEELTAKIAEQAKDPMISSLEDVYLHCYGDDVFEHDLL